METRLIARVAQIAIKIEAIAMEEITRGPSNLQKRSMRRIRALKTKVRVQRKGEFHTRRVGGTDLDEQTRSLL